MELINQNSDKLWAIAAMLSSSLYTRFLLESLGQNWIKTIAHTSTIMLLPILTYVITSVISGNIALSLGMVGALSIVRFRNPVRSPLELAVYFGSITVGITAAVSLTWLLLLMGSISVVCILLISINFLMKKIIGKPMFIASFSEGNSMPSLVVTSEHEVKLLNDNPYLISKITAEDGITYTLLHHNFDLLRDLEGQINASSSLRSSRLGR
jgi:hypothetical protein